MVDIAPIFMVEDEESDVWFLRRALQKAGIGNPVVVAINGREAIRYLEGEGPFSDRAQHPFPGLVVLDLKMPFVDGFGVLTWLQAQPEAKPFPVVVLTSSEAPEDMERARRLGAADYFVKPTHPSGLVAVAQELQARWLNSAG